MSEIGNTKEYHQRLLLDLAKGESRPSQAGVYQEAFSAGLTTEGHMFLPETMIYAHSVLTDLGGFRVLPLQDTVKNWSDVHTKLFSTVKREMKDGPYALNVDVQEISLSYAGEKPGVVGSPDILMRLMVEGGLCRDGKWTRPYQPLRFATYSPNDTTIEEGMKKIVRRPMTP